MIETLFIIFVAAVVLFIVLIAKHVDGRIRALEKQQAENYAALLLLIQGHLNNEPPDQ